MNVCTYTCVYVCMYGMYMCVSLGLCITLPLEHYISLPRHYDVILPFYSVPSSHNIRLPVLSLWKNQGKQLHYEWQRCSLQLLCRVIPLYTSSLYHLFQISEDDKFSQKN